MSHHSAVRVIDPVSGEVVDTIPVPKNKKHIDILDMSDSAREFLRRRSDALSKREAREGEIDWARVQFEDRLRLIRKDMEGKVSENPAPQKIAIEEIVKKIDTKGIALRDILRMYFLQGMSMPEVADKSGRTTLAIEAVIHRFRKELGR